MTCGFAGPSMTIMNTDETRRLIVTVASRTRFYGTADPRTLAARRELAEARADAAEAEAVRLREVAQALAAP